MTWYSNGSVRSRGQTENDLAQGHWSYYYPDGEKRAEVQCRAGNAVAPLVEFRRKAVPTPAKAVIRTEESIRYCDAQEVYRWRGLDKTSEPESAPAPASDAPASVSAAVADIPPPEPDPIHERGFLALSPMLSNYEYEVTSPLNDYQGHAGAAATTIRLDGEYTFGWRERIH